MRYLTPPRGLQLSFISFCALGMGLEKILVLLCFASGDVMLLCCKMLMQAVVEVPHLLSQYSASFLSQCNVQQNRL